LRERGATQYFYNMATRATQYFYMHVGVAIAMATSYSARATQYRSVWQYRATPYLQLARATQYFYMATQGNTILS
jgi:hypothetical protein